MALTLRPPLHLRCALLYFAGVVWNDDSLFDYLADPQKYIKVRSVPRLIGTK